MKSIINFLLFFLSSSFLWASPPLPYSGKISIDWVNYSGDAEFAFSIHDGNGSVHWRNGNTSNKTIKVFVQNGRYTVLLGGQGMNPLPAKLFLRETLYLKVRFDNGDEQGLRHLGPDQRITSTAFALGAEWAKIAQIAERVKDGAINRNMLSQQVLEDINRTITRSMLPASVRADLNRTVTKSMLGADVLSDLNQSIKTITRSMLPASVRADLNRTVTSSNIAANTITTAQLNEQILKYLKPEITTAPQSPGPVYQGQSVTLEGQAEGKFLNYQWFHNGEIIPSATNNKLTVSDLNSSLHDGNYSLVVGNDFGSISVPSINLDVNTTRNYYRVSSADNMEMIWIENDKFIMGQVGVYAPEHNVTITDGYFLGKTEVTQKQYSSVMVGNTSGISSHPSAFVGDDLPVETVTWPAIKVFLQRLNQLEGNAGRLKPGWQYALPTEAEWEFACRAGTRTTFSWGNQIDAENANWNHGNDQNKTLPVMNYPENPWGFFDMHGNVWELTSDWWGGFTSVDKVDPEGAIKGVNRVNRGGSWNDGSNYIRSSSRLNFTPNINSSIARQFGFRIALKKIKQDTKPPQIFLSQSTNITVEAGVNFTDPGYQAHDIRDGEISNQVTVTGSVDVNTTGTYILNYSVMDASGNQDTATRTVTVVDNTAPVLSLLGYAVSTQVKDTPWVDFGATAHDSFDGNLTSSINITGVVDVNTTGVYTLTYSVSDVANNEANITRSVHVMPNTHNSDLNSSVQLQMLWVEPGTFTMGSPTTEANRQSDRENQHNVKISKGFYLGKYEITQAQYEAVMTGNANGLNAKPSNWPNNPNRPVEMVSWTDIQTFLTRLNSAEQASGNLPSGWSYVLPTESQWEYACRAGTSTAYFWGNDINSSRANYNWSGSYNDGNDSKQTVDVGQFAPNSWGFFDMHGNVWEWTNDWYQAAYPTGNPVVDPTGPLSGSMRPLRGGSWGPGGNFVRSSLRFPFNPNSKNFAIGFRVSLQLQ